MDLDRIGSEYRLSSGEVVPANNGILGLTPDGMLTEGYDSQLDYVGEDTPKFSSSLSQADRNEIAEEMIRRWQRWRDHTE